MHLTSINVLIKNIGTSNKRANKGFVKIVFSDSMTSENKIVLNTELHLSFQGRICCTVKERRKYSLSRCGSLLELSQLQRSQSTPHLVAERSATRVGFDILAWCRNIYWALSQMHQDGCVCVCRTEAQLLPLPNNISFIFLPLVMISTNTLNWILVSAARECNLQYLHWEYMIQGSKW